jgi:hypothetical protein
MLLSGVPPRRMAMAGTEHEPSKLAQIKIRRKVSDHLVKYLKEFDPTELFDGQGEQDFAQQYFDEFIVEELIDTIANIK